MKPLALGLLVASCAASQPAVPPDIPQLLAEFQPAVARELGVSADVEWGIYLTPSIPAQMATMITDDGGRYLGYREDWEQLRPMIRRLSVAHELVHLLGPVLESYALSEGLADLLAIRVDIEGASAIWAGHVAALARSLDWASPMDLLKPEPETPEEEDELRALGFFALLVLPPDELDLVCSGDLSAQEILDNRSWETVRDLLDLAWPMEPESGTASVESGP